MGWDITSQPRIGIVAPGAAYPRGFFINSDFCEASFLKLDARQDACHARANDDNPLVLL